MKKTILFTLAAAMAFSVSCGHKNNSVDWSGIPEHEIMVYSVEGLSPSIARGKKIDYEAYHLIDKNLSMAWQIDMNKAIATGSYMNGILNGAIFTLAEGKIGTIIVWNGYGKSEELYMQNSRASSMTVKNNWTGEIIGVYNMSPELNATLCVVNKEIAAGPDGTFKVRIDFGSAEVPGYINGTKYTDFVVSEVQFWAGVDPKPLYPIGDRAYFGVRGPVMNYTAQTGTKMFNHDGLAVDMRQIRFINYGEQSAVVCYIDDNYGGYTGHSLDANGKFNYEAMHTGDGITIYTKSVTYDTANSVIKEYTKYSDYAGGGYQTNSYTVDPNGNVLTQNFYSNVYGQNSYSHSYTISTVDKWGNWTSRLNEYGQTETRVINYYQPFVSDNIHIVTK